MNEELEMLRLMLAAIVAAEPSRSLEVPTTAIAWAHDLELTVSQNERTRSFVLRVDAKDRAYPLFPTTSKPRQVESALHYPEDPEPPRRLSRSKP